MTRFTWRKFGVLHPLVTAAVTLAVFLLGKAWPEYALAFWTAFLVAMAIYLYVELRKPVNYEAMVISQNAIDYTAAGRRELIGLGEIRRVQLVRERLLFEAGVESKWVVYTLDGRRIELMDEWPDRKRLLRAFRDRLPDFDLAAAKSGLSARREGVWPCFELKSRDAEQAA